jgi:hypothetical protein
MYPARAPPHGQRLAGIDGEEVERAITAARRQLRAGVLGFSLGWKCRKRARETISTQKSL